MIEEMREFLQLYLQHIKLSELLFLRKKANIFGHLCYVVINGICFTVNGRNNLLNFLWKFGLQ